MQFWQKSQFFWQKYRFSVFFAAIFVVATPVQAADFFTSIHQVVEQHEQVIAAKSDAEALKERIRVVRGDWFPDFELTAKAGREWQVKPLATDTDLEFYEADLKITQKLLDFGTTDALIEKAELNYLSSKLRLYQTRLDITLEALIAAINLRKSHEVLDYARRSEDNVRKQTGLEQARADAGGGISTDVLQSKTQLAGAQAKRIQAEGALAEAVNSYTNIYKTNPPTDFSQLAVVAVDTQRLPDSIEQALEMAFQRNPRLRIATIDEAVARESVKETRSGEFLPTLELVGEQKYKHNVSGTEGQQRERLVKVELNYPINLGGTGSNTLRAAEAERNAALYRMHDTRQQIEKEVRNAWQQYETARLTAASLRDQASLAAAFLELARKERVLGNRSLIDVLSGETALYNAESDARAKEADILIAAYRLLRLMAQLNLPDPQIE